MATYLTSGSHLGRGPERGFRGPSDHLDPARGGEGPPRQKVGSTRHSLG
jgi:hypothetical protein